MMPKKTVFLTQDEVMESLFQRIKQVARTGVTLLLTGENGTGKEVLAQLAHYYSERSNKPLVAINCGAIPGELVESELFGHEKGAFTGAHEQKKGCFELADGGTLFFDEIGEMPRPMQVKLLRAVETGSFRRVGGKEEIKVDVNLISATNKVLVDQVKSGSFREDLFYRINVVEIHIPALRHRKGDIPLLISHYKEHFTNLYNKGEIQFNDSCIQLFMEYDWPGNVRELKNVVERVIVLSESSVIDAKLLPSRILKSEPNVYSDDKFIRVPVGTSLKKIERQVIKQTLYSVDNNKTEAAKILGFTRKTLHNKLDKYENDFPVSS